MAGGWRGLVHRLHERLVGTGMGERTRVVLRGVAWVGSAAMIARVVTGVTTLLTARWLGPEAWGRTNLALAAAMWIQVPLLLGVPTAIIHAVPRAEPDERPALLRAGTALLALTAGSTLLAGLLARAPLAALLGVAESELVAGLAWCAGFVVSSAATASLSARERFDQRAVVELVFAACFAVGVLALRLAGLLSWQGYVAAMALGYALSGLAVFVSGRAPRPALGPGTVLRARRLLSYGLVATLGLVAGALVQAVARQVTHRYCPLEEVGVLSAYQGGSIQMALYLQSMVTMVFFPVASRTPDRKALFGKLVRLLAPLTVGASLFFAAGLAAWMLLLGRAYPLEAAPFAAFSVAAGLTVSLGLLAWLFASGGHRGMLASTVTWLVAGVVHAAACFVLIPRYGLLGAGAAMVLAAIAGIASGFLPPLRRWAGVS